MKKVGFVALLILLTLTNFTFAKVKVSEGEFIGIINEDGQGPYQIILREAAKRAGIEIEESFYPLKRGVMTFKNKGALTIIGMTESVLQDDPKVSPKDILTSYPLGVYKVYIFTKKEKPVISGFGDLKKKSIGGVIGYEPYYKVLIDKKIKIDYLAEEKFQLEKLAAGRIDGALGFMPDWIAFLDDHNLSYDVNFPIHLGYDYMTVWNTPEGKDFVEKISVKLLEMHKDGTLKKILGDRWMEFEYKPTQKYEWVLPK